MDCRHGLKKLDDNSVDLIITSPPYNVGISKRIESRKYKEYKDNLTEEEYLRFTEEVASQLHRVLKKHGCLYYNFGYSQHTQNLPYKVVLSILNTGFKLADTIIWYKYNALPIPNPMYFTRHFEFVWLFVKSKKYRVFKEKNQIESNVWKIKNHHENQFSKIKLSKFHRAVFPVALPKKCLELSSKRGELVLDPFMGTGTTALSCKMLARDFIGFEITADYIKLAKKRLRLWNKENKSCN